MRCCPSEAVKAVTPRTQWSLSAEHRAMLPDACRHADTHVTNIAVSVENVAASCQHKCFPSPGCPALPRPFARQRPGVVSQAGSASVEPPAVASCSPRPSRSLSRRYWGPSLDQALAEPRCSVGGPGLSLCPRRQAHLSGSVLCSVIPQGDQSSEEKAQCAVSWPKKQT